MTDTVRIQILKAAVAALNVDRPAGVPEATLRRPMPPEVQEDAQMAVFQLQESASPPRSAGDSLSKRRLILGVMCITAREETSEIDEAVEPMLAWADQVLAFTNFSGLAHQVIYTGTEWVPQQNMDRVVPIAIATYEVEYSCQRGDPYTR